jgi:pimeloyl-ACP methyl ester carboxylesterase
MQTAIVSLLSVTALAYLGIAAVLYTTQRSLLYVPTPESSGYGAESVNIDSDGESLKVWRLNGGRDRAIIYFGGNAEQVSGNVPMFADMFRNATVYLVNYRGYGGSSGSPTEQGLYADAVAVYDHVAGQHDGVAVIGRSLGTGVATYLATVRDVERIVLVTPYDSIERVAARHYPIFPVALFLKDKYPSIERAEDIDAPTLVLVAEDDRVVPREHAESLVLAFGDGVVQMVVLEDTTHNTIGASPAYPVLLDEFL